MANNCFYEMKVVGEKNAVQEFVQLLRWDKQIKGKGLGRTYSAQVYDDSIVNDSNGRAYTELRLCGDCAWSVDGAMIRTGNDPSLLSETLRLNLAVEVFSSESGEHFQEHYIISQGNMPVSEVKAYYEFDTEAYAPRKLKEEIAAFCEMLEISQDEFHNNLDEGIYRSGGFGDNCDFCDLTRYLQ